MHCNTQFRKTSLSLQVSEAETSEKQTFFNDGFQYFSIFHWNRRWKSFDRLLEQLYLKFFFYVFGFLKLKQPRKKPEKTKGNCQKIGFLHAFTSWDLIKLKKRWNFQKKFKKFLWETSNILKLFETKLH